MARKASPRVDGRYEIKRTVKLPDGSKIEKSFYGKSKREAEQKYRNFLINLENYKAQKRDEYFSVVADKYIDVQSAGESTLVGYRQIVGALKAHFKNRLIRDVTSEDLRLYINSLSHLSINTIKKRILHIKGIFAFALENDYIEKDPSLKLRPPQICKEPRTPRAYTKAEARMLLNQSKLMGVKGLSVFIPLKVGTRPGETAAIDFTRDIDFDAAILHIQETIKVPQSGEKVGDPKTKTSRRDVPIDDEFIEHLRSFEDEISGYIFDNGHGKPVNYNNFIRHYIKPVFEAMPEDFPHYHAHELRHTCGTLMYESGTDLYDIMRVMGHSDIKVTQIYVHQSQELLRKRIKRDY